MASINKTRALTRARRAAEREVQRLEEYTASLPRLTVDFPAGHPAHDEELRDCHSSLDYARKMLSHARGCKDLRAVARFARES